MKYLYKGTIPTVLFIGEDFVNITTDQIIDLPNAPSSDFVLQETPKDVISTPHPAPTKRLPVKRTSTKKVTTDGSNSEISNLGK